MLISCWISFLLNLVKLLLKDPRINPSDQDNRAIKQALSHGHIRIIKLLLADPRVDRESITNEDILCLLD